MHADMTDCAPKGAADYQRGQAVGMSSVNVLQDHSACFEIWPRMTCPICTSCCSHQCCDKNHDETWVHDRAIGKLKEGDEGSVHGLRASASARVTL